MSKSYTSAELLLLEGLDPVRRRPGMYTDTESPFYLLAEVIDNAVDEALTNHCRKIIVRLEADDYLSVADDGRGIPPETNEQTGLSGIELVLTRLHSGGKFNQKVYQRVGGLHGVGLAVVNALSSELRVQVRRSAKLYQMSFKDGEVVEPLGESNARRGRGTTIRFKPNPGYFEKTVVDRRQLEQFIEAKAVLCPGLEIELIDVDSDGVEKSRHWCFKEGIKGYFKAQIVNETAMPVPAIFDRYQSKEGEMSMALSWNTSGHNRFQVSYVNLIPTRQHGAHVNAFRTGVTNAMREFCQLHELMPRNLQFNSPDVCGAMDFLLSVRIDGPQFVGQTKDRLAPGSELNFINRVTSQVLSLWLNSHTGEATKIARFLIERLQKKETSLKVNKRLKDSPALPDKLADCTTMNFNDRELFLVEGDSAGGSARQARNRVNQAILPLRGKILNTWELDSKAVLLSREVRDISAAIGVVPGSDDLGSLRYNRICILADADADGAHIATLICALFIRHFRALVEAGHLYVAQTPLYRIDFGKKIHYAKDEASMLAHLRKIEKQNPKAKPMIVRFKGLGEMNPAQLRQTTMDPVSRQLLRLQVDEGRAMDDLLNNLLARQKSSWRRDWLGEKGNLFQLQD